MLVAVAPHLLLLRDTDGDDVADSREIIYTGLGRFDTHAVLSNIHYGLDNWYWAAVGYSGGAVRVGDETHVFKQGLLRFRLDGESFEVLTSTSNNTWGLGFDATGNVFASTANGEHSVHLAIPNRYFERVRGWHGDGSSGIEDHEHFHNISPDLRQVDHHGQYTAAAGHEIYNAAAFPPEYRQRVALTCEPTGHLVHMDFLVERGAGFVARDGWNLLASEDPWTAPIEAKVGPDGAVWMIDWYNYIVRHNPTPPGFETGKGNAYVTPERRQVARTRVPDCARFGGPGDDANDRRRDAGRIGRSARERQPVLAIGGPTSPGRARQDRRAAAAVVAHAAGRKRDVVDPCSLDDARPGSVGRCGLTVAARLNAGH